MDDGRTCSLCNAEFDIEAEGGYEVVFGILLFAFCVTCNAALVEYVHACFPDDQDDD